MTYSATRLSIYALLSAVEMDLRRAIRTHLEPQVAADHLLTPDLLQKASGRLEKDDTDDLVGTPTVDQLLSYLDFGEFIGILNRHSKLLPTPLSEYFRGITRDIEKVLPIRNRVAHPRPLNYDDLPQVLAAVRKFLLRRDATWKELRGTLDRLQSDPSFVLTVEIPTYDRDRDIPHNLPTPEFDETGFVGRGGVVERAVQLILGPYPVITIVGEGGAGKTSLALKCAYEILDQQDPPFDTVVWTTSKTTQLTPSDIRRIEGAIQDSLGMVSALAKELSGTSPDDPVAEVLAYLREFRVLLIMDNLETVLDDRIRSLMEQLPTGSKVVITSRIGLGAFEFPVKLEAMTDHEAVQLLRALAEMRELTNLVKAPNSDLAGYCRRMSNNPGYIKWFVSAVQVGRRPEEILARPELFLEFCMSNVYEYLSELARQVLRALVSLAGRRTQAELAVLTEMASSDLQNALQELLTTNMISMVSRPSGVTYETRYEVSELARDYLAKHHPVPPREDADFRRRWRSLVTAGERFKAEQSSNPYQVTSVRIRSAGDLPVAKYLADTLQRIKTKRFPEAEALLSHATDLAPEYFEVRRVEAILHVAKMNYPAAQQAYEAAIELAPDWAPLRFWHGGFLMRYFDDVESGLRELQNAYERDNKAPLVWMEIARAHLWLANFDAALDWIEKLEAVQERMSEWGRKKLVDLRLQFYQREADWYAGHDEPGKAVVSAIQLRDVFRACPPYMKDAVMQERLAKAMPTLDRLARLTAEPERRNVVEALRSWLSSELVTKQASKSEVGPSQSEVKGGIGTVCDVWPDRIYGFLRDDEGRRLFFHRNYLAPGTEWAQLSVGTQVEFAVGKNDKGLCAVDLVALPKAGDVEVPGLEEQPS